MNKETNITTLDKLKKGQIGRVIKLDNNDLELRRRLLDMGITQNVDVQIKKIAPLGDPVGLLVRGYELCIRKHDMKSIYVELVK